EIMFQSDRNSNLQVYRATRTSRDLPFDPPEQLALDPAFAGLRVSDPDLTPDGTILTVVVWESNLNLYITTRERLGRRGPSHAKHDTALHSTLFEQRVCAGGFREREHGRRRPRQPQGQQLPSGSAQGVAI